jgi:hypothetical protein
MDTAIIRPTALFIELKVYIKCIFINNKSLNLFVFKVFKARIFKSETMKKNDNYEGDS